MSTSAPMSSALTNGSAPICATTRTVASRSLFGEFRRGFQRAEPSGFHGGTHGFLIDIRGDDGQPEAQPLLPRDLLHDVHAPLEMRRRAAAARRAHDYGYARFDSGRQHQLQVALDCRAVGERHARAEVIRPRVGRTGVRGDDIRFAPHAFLKRGEGEAVTKNCGCR